MIVIKNNGDVFKNILEIHLRRKLISEEFFSAFNFKPRQRRVFSMSLHSENNLLMKQFTSVAQDFNFSSNSIKTINMLIFHRYRLTGGFKKYF